MSGGERGVVDFGKLFTETNEQKFSVVSFTLIDDAVGCYKVFRVSTLLTQNAEQALCIGRRPSLRLHDPSYARSIPLSMVCCRAPGGQD